MNQGPITDVKAVQGNKGAEWILKVSGIATSYTGAKAEITDAEDGFNPTIALFKVTVNETPNAPMKGTPSPFEKERKVEPGRYKSITINLGEENAVHADIQEVKTVL